jgi:hypothetical protein
MKHIILALMTTALLVPAFGEGIKQREGNQKDRIQQGVQNGSLTKREATRLRKQEHEVRQDVRQDRRDGGGLSPREKAQITHEQDQASRRIAKQKHDGQTRN